MAAAAAAPIRIPETLQACVEEEGTVLFSLFLFAVRFRF
jgi:hypothetical protein